MKLRPKLKLRIKSFILASIIISTIGVQAFAIQLDGNSTGEASSYCLCWNLWGEDHEIGVARSNGFSTTYGFSWVGISGKSLYTVTYIGTSRKKATGYGWAQTSTFSAGSKRETVSEDHGSN